MKNTDVLLMNKIANNIAKIISEDRRSFFERAGKRKPKVEGLKLLLPAITQLLNLLFPLSEQIVLINRCHKKFSVTDTTYYKFLQDFLPEEYMTFKKNMYFFNRKKPIETVINLGFSYEEQFDMLNFSGKLNGKTVLDLKLEDYVYFLETYYNKDSEDFYKKMNVVLCSYIDSKRNPDFFNSHSSMGVVESHIDTKIEATTLQEALDSNPVLANISKDKKAITRPIDELKLDEQEIVIIEDLKENSKPIEDLNITVEPNEPKYKMVWDKKKKFQYKLYDSPEERMKLADERGIFEFDVYEDTTFETDYERFEVKYNIEDIPDELADDKDFIYANTSMYNHEFLEDFMYVFDLRLLHKINHEGYGLANRLLIITGGAYAGFSGYKCYRFYEGTFYFIEHVNPSSDWHPAQSNPLQDFGNGQGTVKFSEWKFGYYDYIRKIQNLDRKFR